MNLVYLESVGTFVDTKTSVTYPATANSTVRAIGGNPCRAIATARDIDLENPVHIEDTTEEWRNSLSPEDIEILKKERVNT
jgi:hypothetical protein